MTGMKAGAALVMAVSLPHAFANLNRARYRREQSACCSHLFNAPNASCSPSQTGPCAFPTASLPQNPHLHIHLPGLRREARVCGHQRAAKLHREREVDTILQWVAQIDSE